MAAIHHLSQAQLGGLSQALADPEHEGFSARAFGPDAGLPPSQRYMVGVPGHGDNGLAMPVSGEYIGRFANSRAEALRPEDRYLGGWSSGGRASLDVSKAFPYSEGHKAMNMGIAGGEEAIGMVGKKGKYIATLPVVDPRKLLTSVQSLPRSPDARLGSASRPALGSGSGPGSGRAR